MNRRISRAVRWTLSEWADIRRRARAEGRTPSAVVRDAVAWYCQLHAGGFEPETFTIADLRAALGKLNNQRTPTAAANENGART